MQTGTKVIINPAIQCYNFKYGDTPEILVAQDLKVRGVIIDKDPDDFDASILVSFEDYGEYYFAEHELIMV